jgi:hypothetical protein
MNDLEHTGAIDFVVVEFPRQTVTGELIPSLLDLVDRRIIRILDILIVTKDDDGRHAVLQPDDVDPAIAIDLAALTGASSGLLDHDDADEIAAIMEPGTGSLTIVYENLWSLPFATAAREAGGLLISNGHIPTQAIVAALDALER